MTRRAPPPSVPLYERLAVLLEEAGQPDEARAARARAARPGNAEP